MKSKGDPILDAQALCEEGDPLTYEDLHAGLTKLGWAKGVCTASIEMATGFFIVKKDDGKFHSVMERIADVVPKS